MRAKKRNTHSDDRKEATGVNSEEIHGNENKFKNIRFSNKQNGYNIETKYDESSNTITIQIVNQRTRSMFFQEFTNQDISKMTAKCNLRPSNLMKMINGNLSSKELVSKLMRFSEFDNIEQAQEVSQKCMKMEKVPKDLKKLAIIQHHSDHQTTLKSDNEIKSVGCALLLMHFEAPPYIFCNYCFVLKEKQIFEIDKLGLRVNDLNDIIADLQKTVMRYEENSKEQEIELQISKHWTQEDGTIKIKAYKMGRMVTIQGGYVSWRHRNNMNRNMNRNKKKYYNQNAHDNMNDIDDIELHTIMTLPKGWRPAREVMIHLQNRHNSQSHCLDLVIRTDGCVYVRNGNSIIRT